MNRGIVRCESFGSETGASFAPPLGRLQCALARGRLDDELPAAHPRLPSGPRNSHPPTKMIMKRLFLIAACCAALTAISWQPARGVAAELTIGSDAPALDVEHWIQTGNGYFEPVTEFESGKVYVVEFWATWCGPCISSMPHLAEMQNQYRGQGVQFVSITDESLETVQQFLKKQDPDSEKTFEQVTSAYSLTADPDGSSHEDYMQAANQRGIPASFLVGKTGKVEWIGHPMELDEPLKAVVNDSWDRKAFKKQFETQQQMQELMQKISMLAGAGKHDQAIKLLNEKIQQVEEKALVDQLTRIRYRLKFDAGQVDQEVLTYFRKQLEQAKGDPMSVAQFAYQIVGAAQRGTDPGPLANDTAEALQAEVERADDQLKPMLYVLQTQLYDATDQTEKAIKAQKQAVEASEGRQKERMQQLLEQLQNKAGEANKSGEASAQQETSSQK